MLTSKKLRQSCEISVTAATLKATLPPGANATNLSTGCVTAPGTVTCTYGAIANGASLSKSFRIPLHLLSLGHVTVTGTRFTTVTNTMGQFTLSGLPQGVVRLHVSRPGFVARTSDATVRPGEETLVAIQLQEQDPAPTGDLPVVLPPPELDEGPHLSYAIQWFLFTLVALVGFPILIVRLARQEADPGDEDDDGSDDMLGHRVEAAP